MFHDHDLWLYLIIRKVVTLTQAPCYVWHPLDQGFRLIMQGVLKLWDCPLALILANLSCALGAVIWLAWKHRSKALYAFYVGWLLSPYGIQSLWRVHPEGLILLLNVACFLLLETYPILTAFLSGVATWIYPTGFFMFFGLSMIAWSKSTNKRVWLFPVIGWALNALVVLQYPWKEFGVFHDRMRALSIVYQPIFFAHPFNPFRWAYRAVFLMMNGSSVINNSMDVLPLVLLGFNSFLVYLFAKQKAHNRAWLFAAGNAFSYCLLDGILDASHQGIVLFWLAFAVLV